MSAIAEILYTKTIAVIECGWCPYKMYINLGNMQDITEPDVEAVKCPHCGKLSWLDEEPIVHNGIENSDIEEGQAIYDRE